MLFKKKEEKLPKELEEELDKIIENFKFEKEDTEEDFESTLTKEFNVNKKQIDQIWKEINHAEVDSDTPLDLVKILFKDKPKKEQLKIFLYSLKMDDLLEDKEEK